MSDQNDLVLRVGGQAYGGWTEIQFGRGLKQVCAELNLAITNRWSGQDVVWPIMPFAPATLTLGNDLLFTGYADAFVGQVDASAHGIRITARSATQDLVENNLDLPSGQFNGYDLGQIARGVCAFFGIPVTIDPAVDLGEPFPDATMERTETVFKFLERLARLRRVLLTDTPQGGLLLTTCGTTSANDTLVEGVNVLKLTGTISGSKRHSIYIVKGQCGIGGAGKMSDSYAGAGGIGTPSVPNQTTKKVQTQQRATATDAGVPRFRPRVIMAEGQMDQSAMQERAEWEAAKSLAQSLDVRATVQGWRQSNGAIWQCNQLVTVISDTLGMDDQLLIAKVTLRIDDRGGRIAELELAPPAAYAPDPAMVKAQKHKGKKGKKHKGGPNWSGASTIG